MSEISKVKGKFGNPAHGHAAKHAARGDKGGSLKWPALYDHLRSKGHSKQKAAMISNGLWRKKHGKAPKSVKGTKGLVGVRKSNPEGSQLTVAAPLGAMKDFHSPTCKKKDCKHKSHKTSIDKNSALRAARAAVNAADWVESLHRRDMDGKFTDMPDKPGKSNKSESRLQEKFGIGSLIKDRGQKPGMATVGIWKAAEDPKTRKRISEFVGYEDRQIEIDLSAVPDEHKKRAEKMVKDALAKLSPEHRPPRVSWDGNGVYGGANAYDASGVRIGKDTVQMNTSFLNKYGDEAAFQKTFIHESFHRSDKLKSFKNPAWTTAAQKAADNWFDKYLPGDAVASLSARQEAGEDVSPYVYTAYVKEGRSQGRQNVAEELYAEMVGNRIMGLPFDGADELWEAWNNA